MRRSSPSMAPVERSRREEIAELYVRYGPLVQRRCRYLLREEEAARDATQEVFVKVMRGIEDFRHEAAPSTWVLKIATNHCLNLIAARDAPWHRKFRELREVGQLEAESRTAEALERAETVRRLLGRLDVETQQVAVYYFVDEMTQDEIGEIIGRSLPTVRKRIEKFLRIARKELGHDLA